MVQCIVLKFECVENNTMLVFCSGAGVKHRFGLHWLFLFAVHTTVLKKAHFCQMTTVVVMLNNPNYYWDNLHSRGAVCAASKILSIPLLE